MPINNKMAESTTTTANNGSSSNQEDTCSITDDVLQPSTKKRKTGGSGKFKSNWKLPPHIACSRKGIKFASCKLFQSDFSVSHGGFNDITRHVKGSNHVQKLKDSEGHSCSSGIEMSFGGGQSQAHSSQVMTAELVLTQFI